VSANEIEGVASLEKLRHHEHAGLLQLRADRLCGSQPVVGQGRWHPNVGDDHVGPVRACLAQEVVGVCRGRNDVEAALLEDVDDPLAHQGLILSDHDPKRLIRAHVRTVPFGCGWSCALQAARAGGGAV